MESRKIIVACFEKASLVGFNTCAGAVDGILIWMQKPNIKEAKRVGVDQKNIPLTVALDSQLIVEGCSLSAAT